MLPIWFESSILQSSLDLKQFLLKKDTPRGKISSRELVRCFHQLQLRGKGNLIMAKCENCGKTTNFGHNRSFSLRATRRTFRPNLQRVSVFEGGRIVRKVLCARCIRTLVKTA
jgi:large subunit ribosomal protein L28